MAIITGTADDDELTDGAGNDLLEGLAGNDTLYAGEGTDTLRGGEGDDDLTLFTGGIADGGAGDDTVYGVFFDGIGPTRLDGGEGMDIWRADEILARELFGTEDSNEPDLDFSRLDAETALSTGNVTLTGFEAVDYYDSDASGTASWIIGSSGDDRLETQNGGDTLVGGAGNDTLATYSDSGVGGTNGAELVGGAGDDRFVLRGGGAIDRIDGGSGIDLLLYDFLWTGRYSATDIDARTLLTAEDLEGAGTAVLVSIEGFSFGRADGRANMLLGSDRPDEAAGGGGDDSLSGNGGADSLWGDEDDDVLDGGAAADLLIAGEGADLLIGGDGADFLEGGAGDDILYGDGGPGA